MGHPEEVNRSGVLFILTMLAVLPIVICIPVRLERQRAILCPGTPQGRGAAVHPGGAAPVVQRPNPVIFVPADFVAIGLYLLYINFATGGHWFLTSPFRSRGPSGFW